eukprot:Anaeramoba_flamelloidesa1055700_55.p1 GENE.a1055700_55~~a1055700_55.p1  ORF type:complete len:154 (+),score=40.08 a1055700_55:61-522(+)
MNLKTPTKLKNEDDPLIMEVSLALVSLKEKCLFENRFQNISRQYPVYIPFIPFYGNYQFNYPGQHYSSTQNESQEGLTSECLKVTNLTRNEGAVGKPGNYKFQKHNEQEKQKEEPKKVVETHPNERYTKKIRNTQKKKKKKSPLRGFRLMTKV